MEFRKIRSVVSQTLAIASFTDNTNTTGYIDFTKALPVGAMVLGWKATVTTAFTGNTSAVMQVGIAGDLDKFSANTAQSCFTAGTVGSLALAADAVTGFSSALTPRVTVTGGSDFTAITAGAMTVEVFFMV